ncbi:MAG: PIN domain-containing protein [Candidatus Methylomirabilia bacterium]
MKMVKTAAGAGLGSAAGVLLVLALREPHPARAAVLAAVGSAALALSGLALGAAALDWLGKIPVFRAGPGDIPPPPVPAPGPAGAPAIDPGRATPKILDTNVIIDGRIADIFETGFVEGILVVPQFVLRELQYIADATDALKRNRGRRGLDVLTRLQKRPDLTILVSDRDFPLIREVDAKLVALARETGARIVTNDYNLNKVAEVSGVTVLNINQLANALKPVALPGELMRVTVIKEGKEANQGIAYLEDGTMIVVDNARRFIGRSLEVTVTSAIQTTAGRMIFAQHQPREAAPCAAEPAT